jgi:hypothetical protein
MTEGAGVLSVHLECSFISHVSVGVCGGGALASISVRWKQRRRRHEKKSYPQAGLPAQDKALSLTHPKAIYVKDRQGKCTRLHQWRLGSMQRRNTSLLLQCRLQLGGKSYRARAQGTCGKRLSALSCSSVLS